MDKRFIRVESYNSALVHAWDLRQDIVRLEHPAEQEHLLLKLDAIIGVLTSGRHDAIESAVRLVWED